MEAMHSQKIHADGKGGALQIYVRCFSLAEFGSTYSDSNSSSSCDDF